MPRNEGILGRTALPEWREWAAQEGLDRHRGSVILIHGISSTGDWQKDCATEFSRKSIIPISVDYGYRSKITFPLRRRCIKKEGMTKLLQKYREALGYIGGRRPSVIAHSFGTAIVGETFLRNEGFRVGLCVLVGSVLPVDYDWNHVFARDQCKHVINVVQEKDCIVRLGALCRIVGGSGVFGFRVTHERLDDYKCPYMGHSDAISPEMCREKWAPLIVEHSLG